MSKPRTKRMRAIILVWLTGWFPGADEAEHLLGKLQVYFPQLTWEHLRKDLEYLVEDAYLRRIDDYLKSDLRVPWRQRCFWLTPAGREAARRCIQNQTTDLEA